APVLGHAVVVDVGPDLEVGEGRRRRQRRGRRGPRGGGGPRPPPAAEAVAPPHQERRPKKRPRSKQTGRKKARTSRRSPHQVSVPRAGFRCQSNSLEPWRVLPCAR